jgi:hypothetical protein
MKGIKLCLLGLGIILIGGFILVDNNSNLGGYGETLIFLIGLLVIIMGVRYDEKSVK